jgi:hypothetical protein
MPNNMVVIASWIILPCSKTVINQNLQLYRVYFKSMQRKDIINF